MGRAGGQPVTRIDPLGGGAVFRRLDVAGQKHAPGAERRGPQPAEHALAAAVGEHLRGEEVLPDPGGGQHDPFGLKHGRDRVICIAV